MERASGILMHITSLPTQEGIGTFGKSAYEFVDFLKAADQRYWQILPLGPVGYGNSPYQSYSAFAGNVLLIDLQMLKEEGLLSKETKLDLRKKGQDPGKVDFDHIAPKKMKLLHKAYEASKEDQEVQKAIKQFIKVNKEWLADYSLFMAIKESQKDLPWQKWPKELKLRNKKALQQERIKLEDEVGFWNFVQYEFYKQWKQLKSYINAHGIKVIGDIPIYVASDSSDTWSHPELFKLDKQCNPITVAGCPPDIFSEDGQLWGNPIYDWDYIEKKHFKWWVERIKQNTTLYDVIRIDHFRGFEAYWEVPTGDTTAKNGKWTKGPDYKLFKTIKEELGEVEIIAEDLGLITDEVVALREATGYPGMCVLEFAFDPKGDSSYLPHNCEKNVIAYIGTHDNETIVGWCQNPDNKKMFHFAKRYLRLTKKETYHWGFIRALWAMPAQVAIAQMQDILGLDNTARMNTPSTVGDNWNWCMQQEKIDEKTISKLKQLTKLYRRKVESHGETSIQK